MTSSNDTVARLTRALEGRYLIERELGAGGMATVFAAQDIRHARKVAIKVLHADLSAVIGGERFLAEIRTTAALQHPHILPLFDSGTADGLLFYVMPLLEGDTLRDRLDREKQLSIPEALRIATEVAGALDYAHRHGVVHRDIKPENVLLQDGSAVVADFGIALAVHHAGEQRMTQTGLSLGTPQYMSPEQAMGEKTIDKRADVYALGAVLYELLTGEPPFSGASVQAIVAKVLTEKPARPSTVRDTIPPHVEATVLTALSKLPADRFPTAAQFAEALARPEATATYATATAARGAEAPPSRRATRALPWATAVAALALAAWLGQRDAETAAHPVVRAALQLGDVRLGLANNGAGLAISLDGKKVAFYGMDSTLVPGLFVHDVATNELRRVPSSNFAAHPFFSPDARSLGFVANGTLRVYSLENRSVRDLTPVPYPLGAFWGPDSAILLGTYPALLRIAVGSGHLDTLIANNDADSALVAPSLTADGKTLLVTKARRGTGVGQLLAFSRADLAVTPLGIEATRPVLVGRTLVYGSRDGVLWSVEFDSKRRKVLGSPTALAQSVALAAGGAPRSAVSGSTGTVLYVLGAAATDNQIVLLDRSGRSRVASQVTRAYRQPRFSPDGKQIVVGVTGGLGPASGDIWVLTLSTGVMVRITNDTLNFHPNWEADGRGILFLGRRFGGGPTAVYRIAADGSGPRTFVNEAVGLWEAVPTPDGQRVVFRIDSPTRDILVVGRDSGAKPTPVVATRFDERGIALSPDGKWLAYVSDETGANEVYLRRLDGSSQSWPVSRQGGTEPRWAKSGELFFRRGDSVVVSRVSLGAQPVISAPVGLFSARFDATTFEPTWDVSPDGQQFVVTRASKQLDDRLMILLNAVNPRP